MDLSNCNICPHNCLVNRTEGPSGKCRTDAGFNIASITLHSGEEPVISGQNGICNIFFSGCNMRCIYCQNYQISRACKSFESEYNSVDKIVDRIEEFMSEGVKSVGFVSPSHMLPQVITIIEAINQRKLEIIKVYNTNAYERPGNIRILEGLIDVYLPDFKYSDSVLAEEYSGAGNYPEVAAAVIKEMYRQKGSKLFISDDGYAESGMIIRHLVLPGSVQNSINVLRYIAEEISTNVHISLMSQYYPISKVKGHALLGRKISSEEYNEVVEEMYRLGFLNGYTQDFDSSENYQPDFSKANPFE
jgi:putative pyruvate formate lyase activating enzyme